MFESMLNNVELPIRFLATAALADSASAEDASLVFSGPKFLIAVISGVLLAFAFQIVLTNLSVAAGISILGKSSDDDSHDDHKSDSFGSTVKKIGTGVGIWTLLTVTLALFCACYLAVKLSLLEDNGLGAIVGLVIWAAYYCLLVWVSSTTVGSLIGSVVNSGNIGLSSHSRNGDSGTRWSCGQQSSRCYSGSSRRSRSARVCSQCRSDAGSRHDRRLY
jgi:hypothetical protein